MTTAYPAALDSFTRPGSTTWTDGTTRTDGVNPDGAANPALYGDTVETNQYDAIEALQTKVGTGTGAPAAGKKLRATGTGSSKWETEIVKIDWEVGDNTAKLGTTIEMTNAVADTATDFDRTIIENAEADGGTNLGNRVLRISCPTGVTGANDRRFFPIIGSEDCTNGRIKTVLFRRSINSQGGIFMRCNTRASSGNPWAYIAWHDVVFEVESIINYNTWENDVAGNTLIQGSSNDNGNIDFPGLQRWIPIIASSKYGTTVTLVVPYNHKTIVGDSIYPTTNEIGGGVGGVQDYTSIVTAVGDNWVQYTSGTAATTPIRSGGPGKYQNRSVYPYFLEGELIGTTMKARAWRVGDPQPDWSTANNAARFENTSVGPTTGGTWGLYAGHMANNTKFVEFGYTEFERYS